jgi:DNA-binding Xre family transcriptional regulator
MSFYETLTLFMIEKGISSTELSRRTGIRKSYFSDLRSGHTRDVSFEKALRIFAALGITPNEFAERQGWFNESDK